MSFVRPSLSVSRMAVQVVTAAMLLALVPTVASAEPALDGSSEEEGGRFADGAPDAVAARDAAEAMGEPVEDLSQRTEYEQVFANPDGTWSSETSTRPLWVRDEAGAWHDIDTRLVQVEGGWAPAHALGDVVVSGGGTRVFATLHEGGRELSWKWETVLPEPVVAGDTATYPEVLPNADLVVTALPSGFSHNLVLHEAPSEPLEVTTPVATQGAVLSETADGGLEITAPSGDALVSADAPVMWDATGGSDLPEQVVPVETTVEETAAGTQAVTLIPNSTFLSDPATVYPVTVDPTYILATDAERNDGFVQNNDSGSHSAATELRVGTNNSGTTKARTYLKFFPGSYLNKEILSADLILRNHSSVSCAGSAIRVSRVLEDWTWGSLSWGNEPAVAGQSGTEYTPAHGVPGGCSAANATWDVTFAVNWWKNNRDQNFGLRLKAVDETTNASWRLYRSEDYTGGTSVLPLLRITYNTIPSAATLNLESPCVGACSDWVAASLTPTFTATASDGDSDAALLYDFEVVPADSLTPVADGTTNPAAGAPARWTVPVDKLADDTSYRIRVRASDGIGATEPWGPFQTFHTDIDEPPSTPGGVKVSPCISGCAAPWVTSSTTPELSAKASDEDSVQVELDFEVRAQGGSQLAAAGSSTPVANHEVGTWVVPAGKLSDDGEYEFRVGARDARSTTWSDWVPLTVDVRHAPSVPTGITVTPCQDDCADAITESATPTVTASSSDGDSEVLDYTFEIRKPGAIESVVTGTVEDVEEGTPARWLVPVGALLEGTYEVRVIVSDDTTQQPSPWKPFSVQTPATNPTAVETDQIAGHVVWTPEHSPYILDSPIEVGPGDVLTIKPGTIVKFDLYGSVVVRGGQLLADGSSNRPVVFTSLRDDAVSGNSNGGDATPPAKSDYYSSVVFENPAEVETARSTPISIVDNVSIRYSGRGGCGGQGKEYPMIDVEGWGRVSITNSEFVHSANAAVSVASMTDGLGHFNMRNSRTEDVQCALDEVYAGTFIDNAFQANGWMLAADAPREARDVRLYGNHFSGIVYLLAGQALGREHFDFQDNAIAGFEAPRSFIPGANATLGDVRWNWWGYDVNNAPLPECYSDAHQPLLWKKTYAGCGGNGTAGGYLQQVLPALSAPPPFPKAGLDASPATPFGTDVGQQFGSGSEFASRASGEQSDPVNSATGSYVDHVVDAVLSGVGPSATVERTYNSADTRAGSLGMGWAFGYDANLQLSDEDTRAEFVSGDGQRVQFTKNGGSWRGAAGVTAKLEEDGTGFVVETRAGIRYRFSGAGRLVSIRDRNGEGTTFVRDAATGRLTSAANSGRTLTLEYTGERLTKVTLPDGRHVAYGYTEGVLTSVRDLSGNLTTYGYDAQGRLTSETDPLGEEVMRLAYDPVTGRVSDQWDALDHHTSFEWDPATEVSAMTDPRGGVWIDDYNGGVIAARIDPLGRTTRYTYDTRLQLTTVIDARGNATRLRYNAAGDIIQTSGVNGRVTTEYDADHNPIKAINAKGVVSEFEYDASGNLTTLTRRTPGGNELVENSTVNGRGLVTAWTNALGKTASYGYNTHGDLTSVTTPEGRRTEFTYDTVGRTKSLTDPRGTATPEVGDFTTTYDYDVARQQVTITDPLGYSSTQRYDAAGQLESVVDAKQRTTSYTYDDAGHVTTVSGPDPANPEDPAARHVYAAYTYDANGNTATVTDESGRLTSYGYNAANEVTEVSKPGIAGLFRFSYDNGGNLASVKDPTGAVTSLSYNAQGRPTKIDHPGTAPAAPDVTYTYDIHGNRTTMTDGAGTVTYTYDDLDQLVEVTRGTQTFTYTPNKLGLLEKVTGPAGDHRYTYDHDGLMRTVSEVIGGTTTVLADYEYNKAGLPSSGTLGDGSTWTRGYDEAGRLTAITDLAADATPLVEDAYTLDAVGNPTAITHGDDSVDTYQYDLLDRLTAVCYDTTNCDTATDYVAWGYDNSGNRTSETRPNGTTTYSYDAAGGWLTGTTGPGGTVSYSLDAFGRITGDGTTTYAYNRANQLTSETTNGTTTNYTYDGDGRRLAANNGTDTTNYWWDPRSYQLAAETAGDGTLTRAYHHGLGTLGLRDPLQGNAYYHFDIQGSIRALTATNGSLERTAEYEPYGVVRNTTETRPNAVTTPLGWAGQYTDTSSQSHLRARQYDPHLGSFITPDPAQATSASATYTYANSNPMTAGDPYGLWPSWGDVVDTVNTYGPAVTTVLGVASIAVPALAPVAFAAGAITAGASAYTAYETCTGDIKGSCAGAILQAGVGVAAGGLGRAALRLGGAAKTGARACSFAGSTTVLMADGSRKPIEDIEVGDKVIATDPETGEQVAKKVEQVFVHDDTVVDLVVDGEVITTTEDHPFWSVTDQQFERADGLVEGEKVLGTDGRVITVSGLKIGTERRTLAYNLAVEGIHTYHVGRGEILVHNTCADDLEGLAHVRDRHLPGGADVDDMAGLFDGGVDLTQLARGSAGTIGKYNPATGNIEYVVRSKSIIGTTGRDRLPTNSYTIVRNQYGELVTMHPGRP